MARRVGRPSKIQDAPPRRSTWWTRAQTLTWIMTRRLAATADASFLSYHAPSPNAPRGTSMRWVIDDTLRRKEAGTRGRSLPNFADAMSEMETAEAKRLIVANTTSGMFRRRDVQMHWPSPYGRGHRGGVSPRKWEPHVINKLAAIFVARHRNKTREDLRREVGNVPFSDPERWAAYIRRAMALAICDTLLRRQCRCPTAASVATCKAHYGRRFCFTREEGSRILANIWSWRADGRLPS